MSLIDCNAGFTLPMQGHCCPKSAFRTLLTPEECRGPGISPVKTAAVTFQGEDTVSHAVIPGLRVLDMHPFRADRREVVFNGNGLRRCRSSAQRHHHLLCHGLSDVHYGPVLFPGYRGKEGLTAKVMEVSAVPSVCQENHPPGAIGRLEHIPVTGSLDIALLSGKGAVREDGIAREGLVRAVYLTAPCNGKFMGQFRSSLRY